MIRAFIDSSVLIAAVRSPSGGSAALLAYAAREEFEAVISDDVVQEVERHFGEVVPALASYWQLLFALIPFQMASPTVEDVKQAGNYTHSKDKAIVAGATVGNVAYLVTLDKRHLLGEKEEIELHVGFEIVRPEDMLTLVRNR